MITGEAGINLIKEFEGCKLQAYQDQRSIWTIGYGSLIMPDNTPVKQGDIITQDQADQLLVQALPPREKSVTGMVTAKINQNQFDALVSFVYNLGAMSLLYSTLLKKLNYNPNDPTIAQEFEKWCYAGKVISEGLLRRRKAESQIYFTV